MLLAAGDDADSISGVITSVGAEPLELWWRYILWAQKQGTPKFVEDLCKRCVECFNEKPALMRDVDAESDERYAKIWLKIAGSSSDDPSAIYKHMYKTKIATKLSLFFVNWAHHSHQTNNREFAVKILKSALKKNVEPRQALLDTLAKFAPEDEGAGIASTITTTPTTTSITTPSIEPPPTSHPRESVSQPPLPSHTPASSASPACAVSGNTVAKYRKSEVYPHGDVDVAPNGWEQSLEEIRFGKWRKEKERLSSAESARIAELEAQLRDYVERLGETETRAEKEKKEKERLKANVAELEKTMAAHVEEMVKHFEEQLAGKDEEMARLNTKLANLEEELAAASAVIAEGKKANTLTTTATTEKRDHASAMLTPKGPAAKRQSMIGCDVG